MGDGASVAVERDASTALGCTRELSPLGSVAGASEVGEGHLAEGHRSRCELRTAGHRVGFQSGITVSELATTVGTLESGASRSVARLHGVVGFRIGAVGGDVTSEDRS